MVIPPPASISSSIVRCLVVVSVVLSVCLARKPLALSLWKVLAGASMAANTPLSSASLTT